MTLLYGPLVLKSYRIWKIFDNPTMKHVNLGVTRLTSDHTPRSTCHVLLETHYSLRTDYYSLLTITR